MSQSKVALLLVPAAAAIAVGLVSLRVHFQPPTVPAYALVDDGGETVLAPGGQFTMEARPEAPLLGAIGARAFLLRGDEVRPWDPPFSVARDGAVRIDGPVRTLFAGVAAGPWEIALAVGRPETLPTAPRDVLRARDGDSAGRASWRLVRKRVRLGV